MGAAIFIGDELTAAGFRLVGIETIVPEPEEVSAALKDAQKRAALVIITAELAARIPPAELEALIHAETPALAILPDVLLRDTPPDLGKRMRSVLGIET
ncbi:MAG TPA: V-type ATP synthase subunit F [Pseudolabrys sp.]|nr:V-type ATP synthase subunit F [Pseudolabrys sp.]